ncbi:DnaD domain-containing protein [Erysipelothrix urinaevulpis]|uniref:DnaD domain-containing protein n=1 Tax=Erysipelothrix urinaevulpis TaxID=2683717 RepID=UPI00135CB0B4|nr:DnaD domain protein [Erysipelothrix urinaevulpis]
MWWNKPYVNRRDWVLENLGGLELSPKQTVVVLMIDYYNSHNRVIDLPSFAKSCNLELSEVDETIQSLVQSQVLSVKPDRDRIAFNLDALFSNGLMYEYVDEDIFEVFESEFGRLLSQNELVMLNEWLSTYTQEEIIDALRQALIYQKASMNYINAILVNKRQEGK